MNSHLQDPKTGKMAGSTAGRDNVPVAPTPAPAPFPSGTRVRHADTPAPSGCRWCGHEQRGHGHSFVRSVGGHRWEPPTMAQRLARMRARRAARLSAQR
jgi:hypothetical protein